MDDSALLDEALLDELEPVVARLLDRHLATAREWFPHELVPWSEGRDFRPGEEWSGGCRPLPAPVRSALFVNLLTEDNLPYYSAEIAGGFGTGGARPVGEAWGEWARRWTAEEGRHSIVIRDWLTVTRGVDPVALERARMAQVSGGVAPHPATALRGLAYVTLQELATRIAHHNTGKLLSGGAGYEIMKRVAGDENLHFLFYRDAMTAAFELDPSAAVVAVDAEVRQFAMPGVGIPDFASHARLIARVGIYDFAVHHDQILAPLVLRHWRIGEITGLSEAAERARDALLAHIEKVARAARRVNERREARQASAVEV